jgi:tetratricopeptide (TPR) repeat protein
MGHLLLGGTMFLAGRLRGSCRRLRKAIHLYEEDRQSGSGRQVLYVQDQKCTGLCYLGLGLTIMGDLEAGLSAAREGVSHARALGAIHAMNFSLCYLAGVYHLRRDAAAALECATESLELAREQGFATWRGASQIMRGDALMSLGSLDEGFAEIESGVNAHSDIDAISYRTFSVGALARGLLAIGRVDAALAALEEGIAISGQREERFYLAELLRLQGNALAMKGRVDEAERWLRQAIAVATGQEARLFQLRSAVDLCRLHDPDSAAIVTGELLPAYNCFPVHVVAPDLLAARSLLVATRDL